MRFVFFSAVVSVPRHLLVRRYDEQRAVECNQFAVHSRSQLAVRHHLRQARGEKDPSSGSRWPRTTVPQVGRNGAEGRAAGRVRGDHEGGQLRTTGGSELAALAETDLKPFC